MSHFSLAVLSDGTRTVDELMAPYQEDTGGNVPREYLEFYDETNEYMDDWENGDWEFYFDPDFRRMVHDSHGDYRQTRLLNAYDGDFCTDLDRPWSCESYAVPEGWRCVRIPHRLMYPTFESFMREHECVEPDHNGRYGYWQNPNGKWDWCKVGGYWERWADECVGGTQLRVGDIRWDTDAMRAKAERDWDEGHDDPVFKVVLDGMSHEQYVTAMSHIRFHSVITSDGEWHEAGRMMWFGHSDTTPDEMVEWALGFRDRFLTDGSLTLTVVDCHI